LGTIDYMAPEQARTCHLVDGRADQYALGCTLYFMLTGRAPFPDGSIGTRLLKHRQERPASIYQFRPEAPPELVRICDRMTAKLPNDRYPALGHVRDELRRWLELTSLETSSNAPRIKVNLQ